MFACFVVVVSVDVGTWMLGVFGLFMSFGLLFALFAGIR